MAFRPKIGSIITVNQIPLKFNEHPGAKGLVYGQSGRKATVYQVEDDTGCRHALKVFTLKYRLAQNASGAESLKQYASLPGMQVCQRLAITTESYPDLLQEHPDLSFAVLMPWIAGSTWAEYLLGCRPVSEDLSCEMATSLSQVLAELETRGMAHCDLSASNVMVSRDSTTCQVGLVDVEDLYSPVMERPSHLPAGSPGYAHRSVINGIWSSTGDRFAGAVLLAEMLGWCDESVRRIAFRDSFFDPKEMQESSERFQVLLHAVRDHWGDRLAKLLTRAWYSETLEDCPTMQEWYSAIHQGGEASFEEIAAQIENLVEQGDWENVVALCSTAIDRFGYHLDIGNWKERGEKILTLSRETELLWANAEQSGLPKDWRVCIANIKAIIYTDRNRPAYRHKIDLAQQELEAMLLLDQVDQCIEKGQWRDAQSLLEHTHSKSPRFALLKTRVDLHIQKGIEAQQQRSRALQAVAAGDWEQAVNACRKALDLGIDLVEVQPILDEANAGLARAERMQHGIERINALLEKNEWGSAVEAAGLLVNEFPDDVLIRRLYDTACEKQSLAEKLETARNLITRLDFQGALVLLDSIPYGFQDMAELEKTARESLSWQDQLDSARRSYNAKQVLALVQRAPSDTMDTSDLVQWANKEMATEESLLVAQTAFDLAGVETLYRTMPDDHPKRSAIANWLQEQRALNERVEQARRNYDAEEVHRIMTPIVEQHPLRAELLLWAAEETARKADLQKCKQGYDAKALLQMAAALPQDYPNRSAWLAWGEKISSTHQKVDAVCAAYDLDAVQALLLDLAEDDPKRAEMRVWLSREQNRVQQVEAAQKVADAETVLRLLKDAPPEFPNYEALLDWAETQVAAAHEVQAIFSAYDFDGAQQFIDRLSLDDPRRSQVASWLEREQARAAAVREAQHQYRYQDVLDLLRDAGPNYPELEALRTWSQGWLNAESDMDRAIQSEDLQVLEGYLAQLPKDHPRASQIRQFREMVVQRREQLGQLRRKALQAVNNKQWDAAVNACRQALLIREAGSEFREMLATAEKGLQQAAKTRESLHKVRDMLKKGQLEPALSLCRTALSDDPANEEARLLFLRIREQVEQYGRKLDKAQDWKDALRVWKMLEDKGKLPDGSLAAHPTDPFAANVAARASNAAQMRRKEQLRQAMMVGAAALVLLLLAALIYFLFLAPPAAFGQTLSVDVFSQFTIQIAACRNHFSLIG